MIKHPASTTNVVRLKESLGAASSALTDDLISAFAKAVGDPHLWKKAVADPRGYLANESVSTPGGADITFAEHDEHGGGTGRGGRVGEVRYCIRVRSGSMTFEWCFPRDLS